MCNEPWWLSLIAEPPQSGPMPLRLCRAADQFPRARWEPSNEHLVIMSCDTVVGSLKRQTGGTEDAQGLLREDMREVKTRLVLIEEQYASISRRIDRIEGRIGREAFRPGGRRPPNRTGSSRSLNSQAPKSLSWNGSASAYPEQLRPLSGLPGSYRIGHWV